MYVNVGRKADLLYLDHTLILLRFLLPLGLLKTIFAVVHDLTDGRLCLRSYLDKVEIFLCGKLLSLSGGNDTELFTVIAYKPNLFVRDLFIDLHFFDTYNQAPPYALTGVTGKIKARAQRCPRSINNRKIRSY